MNSNEQVRPFAFPESGKGLKPLVSSDQAQPEFQTMVGRSSLRQKDSGRSGRDEKRRLRQLVSKRQSESDESGSAVLRPAFAVSVNDEHAIEAVKPEQHFRQKRSELSSARIKNESGSIPEKEVATDLIKPESSVSGHQAGELSAIENEAAAAQTAPVQDEVESHSEIKAEVADEAIVKEAIVKEAIVKEAIVKEAIAKEAIVKEAIVKEAIVKEAIVKEVPASSAEPVVNQSADDVEKTVTGKPASSAAATLQKALDDMFRKGLEQGRQEALKQQAEGVYQDAYDQGVEAGRLAGFEEGRQQGLAAGADEISQRFAGIESLVRAMEDHRRLLSHHQVLGAAQLLERLVIEVVRTELRHSPEQIRAVVEEAVHLLDRTEHESIALRVHPDDAAWLQGFVESSAEAFVVRPDPAITRGGCRIEGRLGHVDATLEERLTDCIEQLRTGLLEDPRAAPPIDVSPIYDSVQAKPAVATVEKLRPEPELPAVGLLAKADKPAMSAGDSFFGSGSSGQSELGAWGDLGQ